MNTATMSPVNTTTSFVDQNQTTLASLASVFLRQYELDGAGKRSRPASSSRRRHFPGGMPRGEVKAQALSSGLS